MEITLPTGCNILNSATTFYNYTNNNYTRNSYIIFDGQPKLQSSTTSTRPYEYTGTCLSTGDLLYRPETNIYFQTISFGIIGICMFMLYKIIIGRFIK